MSVLSNEQQYQQALADIKNLKEEDTFVASVRIPSDAKGRNNFVLQYWLSIYLRYLHLSKRLAAVHEVELQPQKLHDVRTMLDNCLGRMLEIKQLLIESSGDNIFLDNLLLDMKLTPEEVEIPIPSYLTSERKELLAERRDNIVSLQSHYLETEPDAPVSVAQQDVNIREDPTKVTNFKTAAALAADATAGALDEKEMTTEEAVRLLQTCERGRQARQRAKFQLSIFRQQKYSSEHAKDFSTVTGKDKAATIVQKVALGYLGRKRALARYQQEKEFLGMVMTEDIRSDREKLAQQLRMQDKRSRQRANIAEMQQKATELEQNIKAKEGPKTMEEMLDEVLMHMAYARLETKDGGLIELPPEAEGGSLKLLGRLPGQGTDRSAKRASSVASESSAKRGSTASNTTGTSRKKSSTSQSVGSRKDDEAPPPPPPESVFWRSMQDASERYDNVWKEKFMESYVASKDLAQKADEHLLREALLQGPRGVMSELRQCVDQLVMMEVNNLKEKLDSEKKSKKKKKAKKAKKPKKPKLKDPTKGVDIETSTNTLVLQNILQLVPPNVRVSDYVGPSNVMGSPLDAELRSRTADDETKKKWQKIIRSWNEDVEKALKMKKEAFEKLFEQYLLQSSWLRQPSAAEVRQAVTEYAVLPLGSQVVHDLAPHPNALLIYGFPNSGKTLLSYAICNESGSNFFNMSPGNFAVTKGMAKIIQTVFYVARMTAPSVIYVEDIEKIYAGKKKGKKKKDPVATRGKKMKKELTKQISALQPTDRVLVLGVSSEPWCADMAGLSNIFKRAVYCPLPDYATRVSLLQTFAVAAMGADAPQTGNKGIETEALQQVALLTDGFTTGQLKKLVTETLVPRRVDRLTQRSLRSTDFIPAISRMRTPTLEEKELMNGFYEALPFQMRKANPSNDFKLSEEELKKMKSSKKSKK